MKVAEIVSKTIPELKKDLLELHKESFNLRMQRASGQNEGISRQKVIRKNIAKIKTVITQKVKAGNE